MLTKENAQGWLWGTSLTGRLLYPLHKPPPVPAHFSSAPLSIFYLSLTSCLFPWFTYLSPGLSAVYISPFSSHASKTHRLPLFYLIVPFLLNLFYHHLSFCPPFILSSFSWPSSPLLCPLCHCLADLYLKLPSLLLYTFCHPLRLCHFM